MACSGCAARREAIKATATKLVGVAKGLGKRLMLAAPPVVKPRNEDAGRRAISRRK